MSRAGPARPGPGTGGAEMGMAGRLMAPHADRLPARGGGGDSGAEGPRPLLSSCGVGPLVGAGLLRCGVGSCGGLGSGGGWARRGRGLGLGAGPEDCGFWGGGPLLGCGGFLLEAGRGGRET